jgi:hypothetical protein
MDSGIDAHQRRSTAGMAGGGLVLLVIGVLAIAAGLGLLAFTPGDAETNEAGGDTTSDTERQGRVGQTVAVGGGAVAFLGLIFIVIGRAD